MSSGSEAFSRVLIDRALTDSGWDLLNPRQVRFETRAGGRADYVLLDNKGMALCVLEAKREDHDPYDAKEQARGYAENLRTPFVLLSNGREHWFWNYQRADQRDAYRIERVPSPEDLDRLRLKNLNAPRPLLTERIGPDYLRGFLLDRKAESEFWPEDARFQQVWKTDPLYRQISRARLRMVLEAVELQLRTPKSENISLPKSLTIEHIRLRRGRRIGRCLTTHPRRRLSGRQSCIPSAT